MDARQKIEKLYEEAVRVEAQQARWDAQPLEFKTAMIDLFADAEQHGLGTLRCSFKAAEGKSRQAAEYIESRMNFLLHKDV